jgi:ribosomal protein S18 acetylase RimI-like enzyme
MSPRIKPVDAQHRDAALNLVLPQLGAVGGFRTGGRTRHGPGGRDVLIGAYRSESLVGAVWANLLPGAAAAIWPPRLIDKEPESTAIELLKALDLALARERVVLLQSLVSMTDQEGAARLKSSDFVLATDLLSLLSPVAEDVNSVAGLDFNLDALDSADDERLERVIERTFEGTQDCPWLSGLIDAAAFLEGFAAAGPFQPGQWLLVCRGSEAMGCLLLSDSTIPETCEILYMGLVPEVRGRGWGRPLTRSAQILAGTTGYRRLLATVDAANQPALNVYGDCGFVECDRRHLFLKLSENAPDFRDRFLNSS